MSETISLKLYAVRSQDGKWFKSKGYGGYGKSWRDDIQEAKLYTRPGPAKSQITWWANNHPSYGIPELVEIEATSMTVIDQSKRVKKAQKAKQDREAKAVIRTKEREKKAAQHEIDRLKTKYGIS